MNNGINEQLERRIKRFQNCNHLFVKTKEGVHYCGFHSSDYGNDPCIVVCLKCGLTNKHIEMDCIEKRNYDVLLCLKNPLYKRLLDKNDEEFRKQFNKGYLRGGKAFDESVFNLISDKELRSNHPMLLYNLAKKINPDATDEEIFTIMERLHEIETPLERFQLCSIKESEELLNRYRDRRVKVLNNEKK